MVKISACIIVKDEEKNISRCIKSIKGISEQIVVVDTGSKDNTKLICKNLEVEVYSFQWEENFAKARNFAIDKAYGDWILWIDADEELCISDIEKLKKELSDNNNKIIALNMINYYGSFPVSSEKAHYCTAYRLFRRDTGIRFIGAIHERLNLDNFQEKLPEYASGSVVINHFGYMDNSILKNKKSERNLNILLKEKKYNKDPWIDYHLAAEYCRIENYKESFLEIQNSIIGFLDRKLLPPPLAYKLKYFILISTGSFENTLLGIKNALMLYPDYVDLQFYKGIILLNQKEYMEAIDAFSLCLEMNEKDMRYLITAGTGSFLAWYYIGLCHKNLNNKKEAEEAYNQSCILCPRLTLPCYVE